MIAKKLLATERQRPSSAREMFWAFSYLALHGFGGVLPWAQRVLVEQKRWLSREEFIELLAFAQVLPGPNVVNLALMVGERYLGWRGALASFVGILLFPCFVVAGLALVYQQVAHLPLVRGALQGMSVAAASLILATACKLVAAYHGRWLWLAPGVLAFVAIAVMRRPMLETLAWILPLSLIAAWYQVRRKVLS